MWYNQACQAIEYGALFVSSADVSISYRYWAERPLSQTDLRPVDCLTASASDKGRFAVSANDGKPCVKCGANEWYKNGRCAPCGRAYTRKWYRENKKRHAEYNRKYDRENPDKAKARRQRWIEKNPNLWKRIRRRNSRRWARENPDKVRARDSKRRRQRKAAEGSFSAEEFKRLCRQYGNRCLACGRADVDLVADHVVPLSRGGSNDISNIQPLCGKCNNKKYTKVIDYRTKPKVKRWIQEPLPLFSEEQGS